MTSNRPMDQDQNDDHLEKHLREFRPGAPRALAIPRRRAPWTALAVAAVLLLSAGASFFARHDRQSSVQHPFPSPPVTIGRLNAALRDNDETFNRLLDDASPNILPHGQHGTLLYELGKE
jgi:hypothetical protein